MSTKRPHEGPIPELRPPMAGHEALAEASRCLYCHDAPCSRACPSGVDVAEFIRKITTGNLRGSAVRLLEANPLAASCARVCPTEELCERACVLPDMGLPHIAIGRLQRYVMDKAMAAPAPPLERKGVGRGKVAVVGGGPAGLSCASRLAWYGHSVTVFDARERPGGLNTYAIADHKIPADFPPGEARWLSRIGFTLKQGVRIGADLGFAELEGAYDVIFLGMGLERSVRMEVPGEDLEGVVDALDLIAAHRMGGPLPVTLANRDVLVIGGGNTATDAALLALEAGARSSTIVYRRTEAEMPAYPAERSLVRHRGVQIRFLRSPVEVVGPDRVTGLLVQPMRLGEPDASGRRRPVPLEVAPELLPCHLIVRAIGQKLLEEPGAGIAGVKVHKGKIVVDAATGRTDNPRYYAGGDCVNGGREVVHAVAEGKRAAEAIHRQLQGKEA